MANYYGEHLFVYDIPMGTPTRIGAFSVTVDGHPLGLLTERNEWERPCSFGVFDMDDGETVTVCVTTAFPFSAVRILPEKEGILPLVSGNTVTYMVSHPVNALSLVFDGDFQGETLHIFSNPIDRKAPTGSTEDILYVAPGYYNLSAFGAQKPELPQTADGTLCLRGGQTLYLAGGAVIDGTVYIGDTENVRVLGSGILMKSEDTAAQTPKAQGICLVTARAKNVEIEGIVCHAHRFHNWTVHFWYSERIHCSRLKVFSPVYASTDGIDISNSRHIRVEDSFIRSCDDAIAIKGLAGEQNPPCDCPPVEDVVICRSVLWNDCNNCMGIGAETRAAYYRDIAFSDIDVLYSYDDRDYHEQLDERSVMTVCCLHGTFFEHITFENIRVCACERVACLQFRDDFWFGSIPGDQSTDGGMRDITYRNITVEAVADDTIGGEILLCGREGKRISEVVFDNVRICGKPITGADIKTNAYVDTVSVK